jgi:hypothetical protein
MNQTPTIELMSIFFRVPSRVFAAYFHSRQIKIPQEQEVYSRQIERLQLDKIAIKVAEYP